MYLARQTQFFILALTEMSHWWIWESPLARIVHLLQKFQFTQIEPVDL